jgi:hypothetical protein
MGDLKSWYWRRAQEDSGANDFDPDDCPGCFRRGKPEHGGFCSAECRAEAVKDGYADLPDDEIPF